MTREVLDKILSSAKGVTATEGSFEAGADHHVNFYIGQPGQAMVVNEVAACRLEEEYAVVTTREKRTTLYVEYAAIHAVSVRPPREEASRRAGFS